MENASKALIISGSVLIVILLIGIGIHIINSTRGITGTATSAASTVATRTYNQTFEKYIGSQRGGRVRDLISEAIASNSNIVLYYRGTPYQGANNLSTLMSLISLNSTYTVSGATYDVNGYITSLTIS